jgi:hypothetical protein
MAFDDPFVIEVDHEQGRIVKPLNAVLCQGSSDGAGRDKTLGWSLSKGSDVFIEVAKYTAFLSPYQGSPTWAKTTTGNYVRRRKTDFTFGDSTKWKEAETKVAGDWYLNGSNLPANETMITTATFGKNRGFYVSYLVPSTGTEDFEVIQVGWNSTATLAGGVGLSISSTGNVLIYRDGVYRGQASISGFTAGNQTGQRWVSLLLIPGRKSELIVVPDQGTGFTFDFEELNTVTSPEITPPSTKFWAKFPSTAAGRSVSIQIAPITYPTSGVLAGVDAWFSEPPDSGDTLLSPDIFWDEAYAGTTGVTASLRETTAFGTVFAPNGTKISATPRFDLTGDGNYTPFIYGGVFGYREERGLTDDAEIADITNALTQRSISVGETPDATKMMVSTVGLDPVATAGMVDPLGHMCRPIRAKMGGQTLFDGVTMPPSVAGAPSEAGYELNFECLSRWHLGDKAQFRAPYALDGFTFVNSISFLLRQAGVPDALMNIENPSITLDSGKTASLGEWSLLIRPGDTVNEWIAKVFEGYAGNWFYNWVPKSTGGMEFKVLSPTGMGSTPVLTLWGTVAEAKAQLVSEGLSAGDAAKFYAHRLWQDFQEEQLPPEANEVRVIGRNPKNNQPIAAFKVDYAAADPTTLPSLRPSNWVGYRSVAAIVNPGITSQTSVNRAVNLLFDRLTPKRRLVKFGSPVWIKLTASGQYLYPPMSVTLKNIYDGVDAEVRITGIESDLDCYDAWPYFSTPTQYMGEIISGTTPWRGSLRTANFDVAVRIAMDRLQSNIPYPVAIGGQLISGKPGTFGVEQ